MRVCKELAQESPQIADRSADLLKKQERLVMNCFTTEIRHGEEDCLTLFLLELQSAHFNGL